MAVDTANKAAAKWAELSKSESSTIDKVLKGTATKADTDKLLKLISQYSKLAGDVFKRGVGIIESTADKRISAEVKKRSKNGTELSDAEVEQLVKDITQAVYQERSGDLLQAIEELVDSANDSLSSITDGQYDEAVGAAKSQYDELIRRLQGQVRDKSGSKEPRQSGPKTVMDVLREVEASGAGSSEESNVEADDEASLHPDSPRGKAHEAARRQEDREQTENWADAWWRKFREFDDAFTDKAKGAGKDLLTDLAKLGGLAYVFSPMFRKWIDEKLSEVGNFFTADNVKKILSEAWDFIKKEADAFANHLKEMVGFKEYTPEDIKKESENLRDAAGVQQKKADESQAKVDKLQKEIDARTEAASKGSLFDRAVAAVENHGSSVEIRRQETRKARAELKRRRMEENIKRNNAELAASGGGGGGSSAAVPPSTASGASNASATPPTTPTGTDVAAQPNTTTTVTSASITPAKIETAATPPHPESQQANTQTGSKSPIPPAGGGASGEGYVPSSGNSLLPLSNMIR